MNNMGQNTSVDSVSIGNRLSHNMGNSVDNRVVGSIGNRVGTVGNRVGNLWCTLSHGKEDRQANLKIDKILVKSFITGVNIISNHKKTDTFFYVRINENNTKIFLKTQ